MKIKFSEMQETLKKDKAEQKGKKKEVNEIGVLFKLDF
jgi:hypothetical protein